MPVLQEIEGQNKGDADAEVEFSWPDWDNVPEIMETELNVKASEHIVPNSGGNSARVVNKCVFCCACVFVSISSAKPPLVSAYLERGYLISNY